MLSGNCGVMRAGVRLGTLAGAAYAPVRGFFGAGLRALHMRENPTSTAWGPGISLLEFVCARRASVFRADYLGMKDIVCLLLLISGSLASFAAESTFLVRKRVSEVQFTLVATDPNGRPRLHLSQIGRAHV